MKLQKPAKGSARKARQARERKLERFCRAKEVALSEGVRCQVPSCWAFADGRHHIVFRSKSRALKWEPTNRLPICEAHHSMVHDRRLKVERDDDGRLWWSWPERYL